MKESRTSNVIKNSFASLMLKIVGIFVQFVMRTAFIYLLGNEYTGISGLFTDVLNVLSLMEMGLDTSMVYALYKPLAENDEKKIAALMNFYKVAFRVIGIVVFVAGMLCLPFLGYIVTDVPNIKENIYLIFIMYVLTSASSYFLIYKSILLRADQKSRIISKWSAIIQMLECIVEILLLFLYRQFFTYLVVHFLATLIKNLVLSSVSTKMYPQYFKEKGIKLEKRETAILFRDIMCLTAYNMSGVIINSTDSIFISAFVGTVEVAIIGNYTLIINSVRTCVEQIVNAAKPSIGNLAVTSSCEKQKEIFDKMNFLSFYIACFCCACFYTLLTPFIGNVWLNPSYIISEIIIAVLIVNFYIAIMVLPVESFRTANGLFVQGWIRPVIMAGMNIVLDFILGKQWGIIGILLATTISRVSTQVWYDSYLIYKRIFLKKPWEYYVDYIVKFIVTLIVCAITELASKLISVDSAYINFVCRMLVAVIVPNIVLVLLYHRDENLHQIFILIKGKFLRRL